MTSILSSIAEKTSSGSWFNVLRVRTLKVEINVGFLHLKSFFYLSWTDIIIVFKFLAISLIIHELLFNDHSRLFKSSRSAVSVSVLIYNKPVLGFEGQNFVYYIKYF